MSVTDSRRGLRDLLAAGGAALVLASASCSPLPEVPAHPTWADVEPIMAGECSDCHGSRAGIEGFGYRLDFFDMTPDVCGDAAQALGPVTGLAGSAGVAALIDRDITPPGGGLRAQMPPAPGTVLTDWQRETIDRWTSNPVKGPPPAHNHPPTIEVRRLPATVDAQLAFSAILDDADGEPVLGVIEIENVVYQMNRAGSFAVSIDSSGFPVGTTRMTAVLCDGWVSATYDLGPIQVQH